MKRRTVFCAALLLVCTMMSDAAFSVKASGISYNTIKEMETQIKNAQKEKDNLKKNITNLEKVKKELEKEKGNLKNYVTKLDQNVAEMENNIADLKNQIVTKEAEIIQASDQLEAARETVEKQYESMRTRIRFMYEAGTTASIWELLMSADSIGDFLNKADYINSIYAYDQKMWEEYQMNCESVRDWYNGYLINGKKMYNPNSVYMAMTRRKLESYWKNTSAFDTINTFITLNFDGLKEDVMKMLSGFIY